MKKPLHPRVPQPAPDHDPKQVGHISWSPDFVSPKPIIDPEKIKLVRIPKPDPEEAE